MTNTPKDDPTICVYCGQKLDGGIFVGAGDGRGQKFAHVVCLQRKQR